MDPITLGLGTAAASALAGWLGSRGQRKTEKKKQALLDQAVQRSNQEYADLAPIRALALSGLQNPLPQQVDLSAAFGQTSNPFSRVPPQGGAQAAPQQPQMPQQLPAAPLAGQQGQDMRQRLLPAMGGMGGGAAIRPTGLTGRMG